MLYNNLYGYLNSRKQKDKAKLKIFISYGDKTNANNFCRSATLTTIFDNFSRRNVYFLQ
jgi:hypothetical protein